MDDFIAGLPKVELHVHLEGSLRAPTMSRLAGAELEAVS
jgi:adenosine deaminase